MTTNQIHIKSMISHLSAKVSHFYDRFYLSPFQFFGEKEIHYWFHEELEVLRREDSKFRDARLIREFPTSVKYIRNNGKLTPKVDGRRAFIDIVLECSELSAGFEFYFGKQTIPKEVNHFENVYHLRERSLNVKEVLLHTENDCERLANEPSLLYKSVIVFIAGFANQEQSRTRFIERKRKPILEGLSKISEKNRGKIKILYIEKFCVGGVDDPKSRFKWQNF